MFVMKTNFFRVVILIHIFYFDVFLDLTFLMNIVKRLSHMRIVIFLLLSLTLLVLSYILIFPSQHGGVSAKQTIKSTDISRMTPTSSTENQLIIFQDEAPSIRLYLDMVRDTVCGLTLRTQEQSVRSGAVPRKVPFNLEKRIIGQDWPLIGISMIGQKRLINVEWALRFVIANGVPGDFIECGVWRGGTSVFARAVLKALDVNDRHVWLADSFQGLPKPRTTIDLAMWSQQDYLKV